MNVKKEVILIKYDSSLWNTNILNILLDSTQTDKSIVKTELNGSYMWLSESRVFLLLHPIPVSLTQHPPSPMPPSLHCRGTVSYSGQVTWKKG